MTKRETGKEINIDDVDMDFLKDRSTDIPGLIEYAHTVGGFSITPTDEGMVRSNAMSAMEDQTQIQLDQIFEQMKLLAEQAKKIQTRADISYQIYQAKMNFKPLIGKEYYLYEKESQKILTMLSPEDWKEKIPYDKFIARVELLADHTWKVINTDN